jgi:hypothetical protein
MNAISSCVRGKNGRAGACGASFRGLPEGWAARDHEPE